MTCQQLIENALDMGSRLCGNVNKNVREAIGHYVIGYVSISIKLIVLFKYLLYHLVEKHPTELFKKMHVSLVFAQ